MALDSEGVKILHGGPLSCGDRHHDGVGRRRDGGCPGGGGCQVSGRHRVGGGWPLFLLVVMVVGRYGDWSW